MTSYPNQAVTLTAEFRTDATGPLVDVTGLTITVLDPSETIELATTSTGIVHASTGTYTYVWTIPSNAVPGDHTAIWVGNGGAVTASEIITVNAAAVGTWCTVADVLQLTGKTVAADVLYQANATLELHLGRTYFELVAAPDNGGQIKIGRRDMEWLRRACAYQCAWQVAQPDMFQRLDMDMLASTGRPIQLKDRALVLAPLARKALGRVSWLRSRSLHTRSPFEDGMGPISPNAAAEVNDYYETWSAI